MIPSIGRIWVNLEDQESIVLHFNDPSVNRTLNHRGVQYMLFSYNGELDISFLSPFSCRNPPFLIFYSICKDIFFIFYLEQALSPAFKFNVYIRSIFSCLLILIKIGNCHRLMLKFQHIGSDDDIQGKNRARDMIRIRLFHL